TPDGPLAHRDHDSRSLHQLRQIGGRDGRRRNRSDRASRRSDAGAQKGHRHRQERRAGYHRRRHAAAVRAAMKIVALSSVLTALLCANAALAAQAPPPGDADRGKANFLKYGCYTCHGYDAQGVPGKKLAPNPLPYAAFSNFVRTSPGEMPTFTQKVLPDQDL